MKKKVYINDSVFESLRDFFNAVDTVGFSTTLYVKDPSIDSFDTFRNVHIELLMAIGNSGIRIQCEKEDINKYNTLGMKNYYDGDTAEFICNDNSDFQFSVKSLEIHPNEFHTKYIVFDSNRITKE